MGDLNELAVRACHNVVSNVTTMGGVALARENI